MSREVEYGAKAQYVAGGAGIVGQTRPPLNIASSLMNALETVSSVLKSQEICLEVMRGPRPEQTANQARVDRPLSSVKEMGEALNQRLQQAAANQEELCQLIGHP